MKITLNQNFFRYFKEEFSKIIKDSKQNFDTIFNKFLKNNGYRDTLSEVWVISKILEMSNKIDKNVYDKLINFLFKSISIVNYNIDYLIKIFWFVNKESKIKFIQKIFRHNKTLEFKGMLNSLDKSSLYHFLEIINHLNLNSEIENNIKNLKSTIIDILNNKGIELPYSNCEHDSLISLLNKKIK